LEFFLLNPKLSLIKNYQDPYSIYSVLQRNIEEKIEMPGSIAIRGVEILSGSLL
jgi:hypothetical protein